MGAATAPQAKAFKCISDYTNTYVYIYIYRGLRVLGSDREGNSTWNTCKYQSYYSCCCCCYYDDDCYCYCYCYCYCQCHYDYDDNDDDYY